MIEIPEMIKYGLNLTIDYVIANCQNNLGLILILCAPPLKLEIVTQANATIAVLDKRQRDFDKEVASWKMRVEELQAELDASQRECRNYSTEIYKLRSSYEETIEHIEIVKRENKTLSGKLSKCHRFEAMTPCHC